MLKYLFAAIVLICGASLAEAQAPYDNDQIAQMKRTAERMRTADATVAPPAYEDDTPDAPPPAGTYPENCKDCPPPRHYDNVEVVKTSRDVDQSRVINTQSVVHVPPRKKEINKLIVREDETRNVGVVQHNHTIIEKEVRYVKRRPPMYPVYRVQTMVQPVCQSGELLYWIVRRGGEAVVVPGEAMGHGNPCAPPPSPCNCGTGHASHSRHPRYAHHTDDYAYRMGMPAHALQAYGYR